jgi:hypothetical protein
MNSLRNSEMDLSDRRALNPTIVVPTQRARRGVTGYNVRYVLGFGLLAIVVVFAAIWFA